ncbi:hypothetical protein [Mucilaginibacter celer]|uniref:Uncharacterized protein n=1 Tax=Mucilaginibacter celer TaxID=2305508 RepID=A0A494W3R9_9SPHI|nr:hypothetical protein [Mucilaginibacter celer]AYL97972.1 hypothetical protein HYN43_022950 [Mucilaginibacter celer]
MPRVLIRWQSFYYYAYTLRTTTGYNSVLATLFAARFNPNFDLPDKLPFGVIVRSMLKIQYQRVSRLKI